MQTYVTVEALQDVVVMAEKGSKRLEKGGEYELGPMLAHDLARAGYVRVKDVDGENSAVEPREGDEIGKDRGVAELAAVEPKERAVASKGRRRKGGI